MKKNRNTHYVEPEYTFKEADERISNYFDNHGFQGFDPKKREKLSQFYLQLQKEQKIQNITRLIRLRDVAIKHFIDCLIVERLFPLNFPLMDIGTGAGFPGIPLALQNPNAQVILVEGVQKRVQFLKKAREVLKLENLTIIGRYFAKSFHYPSHTIITRALSNISSTLELISPSQKTVVFMKGPNCIDEIKDAQKKFSTRFRLKENLAYQLPSTPHQRRLVVFEGMQ